MATTINAVTALGFASILLLLLLPPVLFANYVEARHATTLIVSTRDHFLLFSGNLYRAGGYTDVGYDGPSAFPSCTNNREIVVYVHGWNTDEEYDEVHSNIEIPSAVTQFNIVKQALWSVGYTQQPVIGFSWDSDAPLWNTAKKIADKNGLKLAKFILDFKSRCENAEIRLVGHSLGARVILNALDRLHNDPRLAPWNAVERNYRVASVHLLGAAVNPEAVSMTQGFGIPIRDEVDQFHNKFSLQDDVLETAYRTTEGRIALGEGGAQGMASGLRDIYHQQEVSSQISRDIDGDRINDYANLGDDHMGYAGVVNKNSGQVTSDGVMNLLVTEWRGS